MLISDEYIYKTKRRENSRLFDLNAALRGKIKGQEMTLSIASPICGFLYQKIKLSGLGSLFAFRTCLKSF